MISAVDADGLHSLCRMMAIAIGVREWTVNHDKTLNLQDKETTFMQAE